MGRYLHDEAIVPDLVLCSSAVRARQTLELLRLAPDQDVLVEDALYYASGADLLARCRALADAITSVLLIGHNPSIHELAVFLAGEEGPASFPTAALADLRADVGSWTELRRGSAALQRIVTPRGLP